MDLRNLTEVIWPRRYVILLTSLLFASLAYGLSGLFPVTFASNGLLLVDAPDSQQDESTSRATDTDVLRSPSLLANVVDALGLAHQRDLMPHYQLPKFIKDRLPKGNAPASTEDDLRLAALDYLQQHLTVAGSDDSRVLSIGFSAGTPELAASVVNELMRQYLEADFQAQRALAAHATDWLSEQAKTAEQEADAADRNVLAFEAKNPLVSLQDGTVAALDLNRQWEQLAAAKQDVVQAQLNLDMAKNDNGDSEASSATAMMLRQQQSDVMQRLASAGASMGYDNPARIALEDELRAVQRQIGLDNRNTVAALAQRLAVAKAQLAAVQADIAKASASADQANEHQLELQSLTQVALTKRSTYESLLDRLQTAELAANQTTTARIVSLATPPAKPQPSKKLIDVILGFLTGAILATSYLLLRQLLNARVGSIVTLNELSGVPSLGALPRLGSGRNRMTRLAIDQPNCAVAETLRGMRLAVHSMNTTIVGNVVLVSSAERGEGKTSVAAALALRAADDGMRVLLIEGDLHRPRLARELGLETLPHGLEAVLSGGSYHGSLLQTHPSSGMHCLLAVGSARNPIVLLESKRFAKLIGDARSIYDLIVIDSPPVLRVPDAILLSRSADQIVLVVREDRTSQRDVTEAINRFPPDRQAVLATLLVGARTSRGGAQGYYAGYDTRRRSRSIRPMPKSPDDAGHAVVPQGRDFSSNPL